MKYKRFNTLFYSVTAVFLTCCSAGELGGPDYAEIPFTIENKRIVVEAVANGKKGRFVFDTGTTESYLDIFVMNLVTERYTIIPYKGEQVKTRIYNLNEITFGDIKLRTKSWVIKHSDLLLKVQRDGFDGLLGALTFEGYWCELSFSKSKIILHKEKPGYFTHFSPVMILNYFNADFFIPVIIDGETFYFDIDTGSPYGIYFPGGLVKAKDRSQCREIMSTHKELDQYHLVKTGSIHILDETYTDSFVMTNSIYSTRDDPVYNNLGELGIDFLKYYDFLFDYRDLREGKASGLYYEPNTLLEERNYGVYSFIKEVPDFGILNTTGFNESGFVIHRIIKDSIAYKTFGLRPGMVIAKVNGKPITEIPRTELFLPEFYLTVDNYTVLENGIERTIASPLKDR